MDVSLLESIGADRKMAAADRACFICYESHPPLIQCGCACRDDGGLAHVDCLEQAAVTQAAPGGTPAWWECRTCKQGFAGACGLGWRGRGAGARSAGGEPGAAGRAISSGIFPQGRRYAEAEEIFREVRAVSKRVLGAEHPKTLLSLWA